ncbi:hypothetical protein [Oleiphilus sp. HI0066]
MTEVMVKAHITAIFKKLGG